MIRKFSGPGVVALWFCTACFSIVLGGCLSDWHPNDWVSYDRHLGVLSFFAFLLFLTLMEALFAGERVRCDHKEYDGSSSLEIIEQADGTKFYRCYKCHTITKCRN